MKKIILLVLSTLIFYTAHAKPKKDFVVVEKRTYVGIEQMSVHLAAGKLKLISNSNFLLNVYPVKLGKFDVVLNPEIQKLFSDVVKPDTTKDPLYPSHHDVTVYVNGKKIPMNSPKFGKALDLVEKIYATSKYKAVDGIVINNKKQAASIKCEKSENETCEFKYGYLHLR